MNIVITGSSRGIGKFLAEFYLKNGHNVIGCSRSNCDIEHKNYRHFSVDVINEKEIQEMAGELRRTYKVIDVLINNAGAASMNHFLLTPTETARRLMEINYLGTFTMCREISRLMKKSAQPRIINFGTVAVALDLAGEAAYASAKAAVTSLTKILAKELAQFKITVNAVGPTPIKTALIAGVPDKKLEELLDKQAIRRFGTEEDVLNVIEFFINPKSSFITGQVVYLGGIS